MESANPSVGERVAAGCSWFIPAGFSSCTELVDGFAAAAAAAGASSTTRDLTIGEGHTLFEMSAAVLDLPGLGVVDLGATGSLLKAHAEPLAAGGFAALKAVLAAEREANKAALAALSPAEKAAGAKSVLAGVLPSHRGVVAKILAAVGAGDSTCLSLYHIFSHTVPPQLEQLFSFSTVRVLNVAGNKLTSIPDLFEKLPALEQCFICNNELTELPPSLGRCSKLTLVYLGMNPITALPDSYASLTGLEVLHFEKSKLTELPRWAATELPKLKELKTEENPWRFPPPDVVAGGLPALRAHFAAHRAFASYH